MVGDEDPAKSLGMTLSQYISQMTTEDAPNERCCPEILSSDACGTKQQSLKCLNTMRSERLSTENSYDQQYTHVAEF